MSEYREPRKEIKDPNEGCYLNPPKPESGDEFDRFLRLTGGPPAPRTGHADAVKRHEAKVAMPTEPESEKTYGWGILAPVAKS